MHRTLVAALALLALFFTACTMPGAGVGAGRTRGPAVDDTSACGEVPPIPSVPDGAAAAATAEGGQRASNQPVQMDPARIQPQTVWNRGAGPNTNSPTTSETRQLAGAPSVNQGLILPTSADARASAADNPAVAAITARLESLRRAYQQALDRGQAEAAAAISKSMDEAEVRLVSAVGAAAGTTSNTYNLQNSVNTQTVANGATAGGPGGDVGAPAPAAARARTLRAPGVAPIEMPAPPPEPITASPPTPALPAPVEPGMGG